VSDRLAATQHRPDPGPAGSGGRHRRRGPDRSELATREADLDSLLRRQEELAELTSLATVTVTFVATDSLVDEADVSFVSGLRGGWNALVDAATVATAGIGALLPFAVVAAALGVPVWWVLHRRRRVAPTPPDAQPVA
jgi:hypothetical protein